MTLKSLDYVYASDVAEYRRMLIEAGVWSLPGSMPFPADVLAFCAD